MSKREELRQKRRTQGRRDQIIVISAITVAVLVIASLFIYPSLKPVGSIVVPDPNLRPLADRNTMGDVNAPVKVVVYSDFQCPACRYYTEQTEPRIVSEYIQPGKVSFQYIPYRVIGPESDDAAAAAYCAADQNKFWEYHDILFANQVAENRGDFSEKRLLAYAEKLDLNTAEFNSCYQSNKYRLQVERDQQSGASAGVNATPTFFVNGTPVDQTDLESAILTALGS